METSLHRQLKQLYASDDDDAQQEVRLGDYRIDVVAGDELIEIQHGSLSAIRNKVQRLLKKKHRVRVVKPIVARKLLVKREAKGRRVVDRRMSPKRCTILDVFHELIYFTRVFPHPNLLLEVPLVEVEEWRYPGHGRRRRRRQRDHQVEDQKLVDVNEVFCFRTAQDLTKLIPRRLPSPFHTGDIAQALEIDRWFAQRIAYCLRHMGGIKQVGKKGNALLYQKVARKSRKTVARRKKKVRKRA